MFGVSSKVLDEGSGKNFKVMIRVRPPLRRELEGGVAFRNVAGILDDKRSIMLSESLPRALQDKDGLGDGAAHGDDHHDPEELSGLYATHSFTFDRVYGPRATQGEVYADTAQPAVMSCLEGYNATIIAYGQTGTGKTYTMEGFTNEAERGIIPRSTEAIFHHIEHCENPQARFLVRASYLQIYNEVISDLLKPERSNLVIREDKRRGVFVEGLSEWVVRSPAEIYGLMERGAGVRATGSTKLNELSSRSHAIFIIIAEQTEDGGAPGDGERSVRIGKLNLVDLAGSERVRVTGATGRRLEECKRINQSLSALGNVIAALTDPRGRSHIPYRDSKLTRILEDSLGGNCKTTMMAMVSPALESLSESLSTLKFANRAKNIKNEAHVNEDLDQKALLRRYERELRRLRSELSARNASPTGDAAASGGLVGREELLDLEERRRRAEAERARAEAGRSAAEADRLAAVSELERRSREVAAERLAKRQLEERIATMGSQLLVGGRKVEDTPAFHRAVQVEHERIRGEYEEKVADLERERQALGEDRAQIDLYKQLLLKQRDIMIALTGRLNERDASILALQEELDAYDSHQRMMEDALDQKTAMLIQLQRGTMDDDNDGGDGNIHLNQHSQHSHHHHQQQQQQRTYEPEIGGPEAQVVFEGGGGGGGQGDRRLNAHEKVDELSGLLATSRSDVEAIARELEDLRAEKVSLEYLLRERLEKMVAAEVRERIEAYKADQQQAFNTNNNNGNNNGNKQDLGARAEIEHLREELAMAQAQIHALRTRASGSGSGSGSTSPGKHREPDQETQARLGKMRQQSQADRAKIAELEARLRDEAEARYEAEERAARLEGKNGAKNATNVSPETLLKERQAIKVIMEKKIKGLVDSIAAGSKSRDAAGVEKNVATLQKLVNASVAALNSSNV